MWCACGPEIVSYSDVVIIQVVKNASFPTTQLKSVLLSQFTNNLICIIMMQIH